MLGNNKRKKAGSSIARAAGMAVGTFFLAVFVIIPVQPAVNRLNLVIAFPVLLLIILMGVLADIVGVSVAVADEAPFHALSAKKMAGAREALRLIRNADRVSSFFNDIIGDLSGTISGAAAAAIVFRLADALGADARLLSMITLGSVAALTVGGKAAGKGLALRRANEITLQAGKVLHWIGKASALHLVGNLRRNRGKR